MFRKNDARSSIKHLIEASATIFLWDTHQLSLHKGNLPRGIVLSGVHQTCQPWLHFHNSHGRSYSQESSFCPNSCPTLQAYRYTTTKHLLLDLVLCTLHHPSHPTSNSHLPWTSTCSKCITIVSSTQTPPLWKPTMSGRVTLETPTPTTNTTAT